MAATEFEDAIPLDVAEALFDIHNSGHFAVFADLMDDFPPFTVPPGFEVKGSAYQLNWLRAALTTKLDEESALAAMKAALGADGWVELPVWEPPVRDAGFVTGLPVRVRNINYCHDDYGQLSLSFRAREPENFLVLNSSANRGSRQSCAELIAQHERNRAMMAMQERGLQRYMPRLLVPVSRGHKSPAPGWIPGAISSSGDSAESEASIDSDWPIEKVFEYFAQQLDEQEWAPDSRSVGSVSASGAWTRTVANDRTLVATLSVVRAGENRYHLRIAIEVPGGHGGPRIVHSH